MVYDPRRARSIGFTYVAINYLNITRIIFGDCLADDFERTALSVPWSWIAFNPQEKEAMVRSLQIRGEREFFSVVRGKSRRKTDYIWFDASAAST